MVNLPCCMSLRGQQKMIDHANGIYLATKKIDDRNFKNVHDNSMYEKLSVKRGKKCILISISPLEKFGFSPCKDEL